MSLIFNGFVYDKPMYSIVAYNRAQLPPAFEQMEKLRRSAHLVGYVRKEAFQALEKASEEMDGQDSQEQSQEQPQEQPIALLKFTLYRLQKKAPEPEARPWVFCPSLTGMEEGYTRLASNCPGAFVHQTLAGEFACSAHFADAFENLVFLGREEAALDADNATPVKELLATALGDASVLMGHFSPKGASLCPSTLALHRKARSRDLYLLVRDRDRAEITRDLCLPKDPLRAATRLEGGRALLLAEHLTRLARLAREHAIPSENADALVRAVSSVELPMPGSEALWSGGLPCPWGMLPAKVEEELKNAGTDMERASALEMELLRDGEVRFATHSLDEDRSRKCGVCRSCLDERSDAWQLDTTRPLQDTDEIYARVFAGELDDALVVNRCAVVAGTGYGALLSRQGAGLFCVPRGERARDSVCLDFLLGRRLVEERLCGLARILSCSELFRATSLHGIEKLEMAL